MLKSRHRVVPRLLELMSRLSLFFFILGKPIPAPNPIVLILSGAVEKPSFIASSMLVIRGPYPYSTALCCLLKSEASLYRRGCVL